MLGHDKKNLKPPCAVAHGGFFTVFFAACRKTKIVFRTALRPRPSLGSATPSPPKCGRFRFEVVPAGTACRENAMRHTRRRAAHGPVGRLYGSSAPCSVASFALPPPSLPVCGSLARPRRRGKIPLGGSPSPRTPRGARRAR